MDWQTHDLIHLHHNDFEKKYSSSIMTSRLSHYVRLNASPIGSSANISTLIEYEKCSVRAFSALEKVVKHASISGLSEQPSFNDVLYGEGGINCIGNDQCVEPKTNLTLHFLDCYLFPNGAFQGFGKEGHVGSACRKKGCMILHNNWISGRQRKLERQVRSGLLAYSPHSRTCLQSFHKGAKKRLSLSEASWNGTRRISIITTRIWRNTKVDAR